MDSLDKSTEKDCVDNLMDHLNIKELVEQLGQTEKRSIALQFAESLLSQSAKVFGILRKALPDKQFYVLGDTSYAECCVDDVNASHAKNNQLIVKFGPACLSTASKSKLSDKEYIYVMAPASPDCFQKLKWIQSELPQMLSDFVYDTF